MSQCEAVITEPFGNWFHPSQCERQAKFDVEGVWVDGNTYQTHLCGTHKRKADGGSIDVFIFDEDGNRVPSRYSSYDSIRALKTKVSNDVSLRNQLRDLEWKVKSLTESLVYAESRFGKAIYPFLDQIDINEFANEDVSKSYHTLTEAYGEVVTYIQRLQEIKQQLEELKG